MEWLLAGYWAVVAYAIGIGTLLGVQAWEHRRYSLSRRRNPSRQVPAGRVALLVPCKGTDADLEANLQPLFEQDHDNYELIFIVESVEDAAYHPIRRLISRFPGRAAQLVVAGVATVSGQKVHNLLAATENLRPEIRILAFVDADVRPPRDWLRLLTQRLNHFAAATGYRWFVPKRPTLANCLVSSMDCAVVPIMFPGIHHKVWGGSWAIRREIFEAIRLREAWQGTLSDDLVAGNALAASKQMVAFEPTCILPSPIDVNLATVMSFVRRQFTIGRFYSPLLWSLVLVGNCLAQGAFWGSVVGALAGLCLGAAWTWQPAAAAAMLYALHLFRARLRQQASRINLPNHQHELSAAHRFDIWLGPVSGLACCCGLIGSAVGRRIVWKGIEYEMRYGGRILTIGLESGSARSTSANDDQKTSRRRKAA